MVEVTAGGPLATAAGEVLAVPLLADRSWGPGADWVADQLGVWLTQQLDRHDFTGKSGQVITLPTDGKLAFTTLVLVGLGSEVTHEEVRQAAGVIAKTTRRAVQVATTLHQVAVDGAARATLEGFLMGQYRFDKYRSEPKPLKTERLQLLGDDAETALTEVARARIVTDAVAWVRDLVNEPAAGKPPVVVADLARELATRRNLGITVYEPDRFAAERFGGLMGVAGGSHQPARLVVLRYEPADARTHLALVGKGIIFDSGGLSLKPADAMETMKDDMAGGAAVLAVTEAIAALGLPVRVTAIAPFTENMPGGGAQRPGDVLRARNGKTIEVANTDAEGRLILSDGLVLAAEAQPDLIVDLATLTGACVVALGQKIAGLFSNNAEVMAQVKAAAASAGERVWEMPLPPDYRKNIDSDVADMKNTGPRWGGSINAALFLKEFVGEVPWAHIDIAGPAFWPDDEHYQTKGGSGFGVRTLVTLAEQLARLRELEPSPTRPS